MNFCAIIKKKKKKCFHQKQGWNRSPVFGRKISGRFVAPSAQFRSHRHRPGDLPSCHLPSSAISARFNQTTTPISNLSRRVTHNRASHLAGGRGRGVDERLPAPLLRSEATWHKVSSLAADRRPASSSRLVGIPQKVRFGNGKRRRERGDGGGSEITCWEMSAVVAKTRAAAPPHPRPALPPPPPPGRGASLRFAISGVFNLGGREVGRPDF